MGQEGILGKLHYFETWNDPQAALNEWLRVKDALLAGREPREGQDGYSVADICNEFLIHRKTKLVDGSMRQRTWDEYKKSCELICRVFGHERYADDIRPIDFLELRATIAKGKRRKAIYNEIVRCLAVINFANKNELTESRIRTVTYFERPAQKELREDRAAQEHMGGIMLEASQINEVMNVASTQIKAMSLLAINVDMGNEDCGRLEFRHIDLETGWLDYPRQRLPSGDALSYGWKQPRHSKTLLRNATSRRKKNLGDMFS